MSAPRQGKLEWDNLTEEQRNCLIWPDFLEWGPEHRVEIKRSEGNSDLGIISVALIDVESTICYNIIKRILEEKPAFGKVNQFDWITAVDGKSTLGIKGSEELVSLIRNGKDTVHLCTRTAIKVTEPLLNIKQWSKEKTKVELNVSSKKPEFELAHFYSKGKDENAEDHILIFKVESKSRAESTPLQLNRGDELLSVNGKPVTGKKLRDIYEEIFKSSKVEMYIKKIIRGEQLKEMLQKTAVKYPERIYWNPPSDIVRGANESKLRFTLNTAEKRDSENVFFHIVKEVIKGSEEFGTNLSVGHRMLSINGRNLTNLDNNAASELIASQEGERRLVVAAPAGIKQQQSSRKGSISKRYQEKRSQASSRSQSSSSDEKCLKSNLNSAKLQEDSHASTSEDVSSDSSGMKEPLSPTESDGGSRRRFSFGKKKSRISECQKNDAFASSDNESIKTTDLCCKCENSEENENFKRLDKDKCLWSLTEIEPISFQKICDRLNRTDIHEIDLGKVAARMEVSANDLRKIKQKFSAKGGFGAAEEILEGWTNQRTSNNVGKFREIIETVDRKDIIAVIDEWLKKENICNGCGCILCKI